MAENDIGSNVFGKAQDGGEQGQVLADQPPKRLKLAQDIQRRNKKAAGTATAFRKQRRDAQRNYDSHQWDKGDELTMKATGRPMIVINEIKPMVDAISGIERLNRRDVRFVSRAVDSSVEEDAAGDLATAAVSTVLDLSHGEYENSRIYKDMFIGGMGWGEIANDYQTDLDGRIVAYRIPPDEMSWDPDASRENLEDATWVNREKKWPKELFKARWPDMVNLVDAAAPEDPLAGVDRYELATPYYSIQNEAANPQVGGESAGKNTVTVHQHQWMERELVYRIADEQDPQAPLQILREWQWRQLKKRMKEMGQPLPPHVQQQMPVYYQTYMVRGVVLEDPVELPRGFSLLCVTGIWDEEDKIWYGIVRPMIDPQKVINKSISSALHFTITNAKGGTMYETDAFVNPVLAKNDWARPDAWIEMQEGGAGKVVQRQAQNVPPELQMYFQTGREAIRTVSGINDEMVGLAQGEMPSPAQQQRISAGLAVLGWVFDNIDRFRQAQARCILEFVREFWSHGQLIQVGGDFSAQTGVPLVKDDLPGPLDYTLALDDSVRHNPNLKAQVWQDLQPIIPALLRYGFGSFLLQALKFSPLPTQLVQALQRQGQQQGDPSQQKKQGRGGAGKPPDPPELMAAKVAKMQADAEKSHAQARLLDTQRSSKAAEIVLEGMSEANNAKHQQMLMQHRSLSDIVKAVRAHAQSQQQTQVKREQTHQQTQVKREQGQQNLQARLAQARQNMQAKAQRPQPGGPGNVA